MRRGLKLDLGALSSYRYGVDSYDSTKLGLGPLIYQQAGGGTLSYAGPATPAVAHPVEQSAAIPGIYPWAMQWQNNAAGELDWVFLADNAAAAATRRLQAYTYNRRTSAWSWLGFITITFPASTSKTIRALRMTYDKESTGTVSVSGTGVTGSGTAFQTNAVCAGNRIGFGSTDPTQITTWYEIQSITNDGALVLTTNAGTIGAGSAYVIEDLRAVIANTDTATTSGGLVIVKGLRIENFNNVGTAIAAAVSTDNVRASYWLKDAATVTNTVSFGMGIAARTSPTSQMVYIGDTVANPVIFKYNIRAALTLSSGADTTAFQYKTGSGGAVTGTTSQANNMRLATAGHGPLNGVEALYFTTTTRVYAFATSSVTTGSTTFLSSGYVMTEVPPGSVNTFAASALMNSLEYQAATDKFIIAVNATAAPYHSYVTQFRTDGGQFDRVFGFSDMQIDQVSVDSTTNPAPSQTGAGFSIWSEGGMTYMFGIGATAILNRGYAVPLGADWEYAASTGSRLILPAMSPINAGNYVEFFGQETQVIPASGASGKNLGRNTEPWRMYYRTSGISDDSGSWTLLDGTGVVTGVAGSSQVQLMIEFRTLGTNMVPSRINNVGIIYDDTGMSDHWMGSSNVGTNLTNKQFGFYFATAYGTTVPRLRCDLYNAATGASLGTDDSVTQAWTWEKSTDNGANWGAYNTTDWGNANTYIRITPTSLADNIKVNAILREY